MAPLSNRQLMEKGYAPYANQFEKLELHHIGHNVQGPVAELAKSNYRHTNIYSDFTDEKIDREYLARKKRRHWKERLKIMEMKRREG